MVEHGVFGGSKITTGQIDQIAHVFYHNFKERLQDLKSSPARSPLPWHLPALHLPHGAAILATPDPSPNGQPYNATAPQRHARERSAFFRHVARGTWHLAQQILDVKMSKTQRSVYLTTNPSKSLILQSKDNNT